ncbi:MAG: hypothetical protein LBE50_01335 [Gallionellaceae bacterium]|nr:hypothetical protein [Gallionellaceae bacterium]
MTLSETPATGLIHWQTSFTGNFECKIPQGTVLVATHDSATVSTGFDVKPVNYEELEEKLVPEIDRTADKYDGYSFTMGYGETDKYIKSI